jgi:hypothetical protein
VATLYDNVLVNTLGMDRNQVISYMNDPATFELVYNQLLAVPTIEVNGPISTSPAH